MHRDHPQRAAHRPPTVTEPPSLRAQAAFVLTVLAAAWALAHLAVALPALALAATLALLWRQRARFTWTRPTRPPD